MQTSTVVKINNALLWKAYNTAVWAPCVLSTHMVTSLLPRWYVEIGNDKWKRQNIRASTFILSFEARTKSALLNKNQSLVKKTDKDTFVQKMKKLVPIRLEKIQSVALMMESCTLFSSHKLCISNANRG